MKTKIIQDLFNSLQCIGLYFRLWKRVWGLAARAWKQDYASSEASTSQPGQKLFLTSDGEATFWKVPLICIWTLLKGRRGTGHFLERFFPYQLSIAKPPQTQWTFKYFQGHTSGPEQIAPTEASQAPKKIKTDRGGSQRTNQSWRVGPAQCSVETWTTIWWPG